MMKCLALALMLGVACPLSLVLSQSGQSGSLVDKQMANLTLSPSDAYQSTPDGKQYSHRKLPSKKLFFPLFDFQAVRGAI